MLILLLLVIADVKFSFNATQTTPSVDGGYYTDVAQHVRDGEGLKTDISLYHQGFPYFPHPTPVYPLWPWVYGMTARFSSQPILVTGIRLATFFFFLSLIFGYLWANRIFPEPVLPEGLPGLRAGHVFVVMLSCHMEYFVFTSLPYTEGIAYTLFFAGAWRFSSLSEKGGFVSGFEVGLWLGLLYLARYQLIIAALAAFPALVGACFWCPNRRRAVEMLLASTVSFGAVLGAHNAWVSGFIPEPDLLRFYKNRGTDMLSKFHPQVQTDTMIDYLKDRWTGFFIAFAPTGKYSFARSFRVLQYSLLIAIPLWYLDMRRSPPRIWGARLSEAIRNPRATFLLFVILFSLGGWLSIHTIHKTYHAEWNFARRQAVTCLPMFFLAVMYLLRRRSLPMILAGILLCGSALVAYYHYWKLAEEAEMKVEMVSELRRSETPPRYQKLVEFLLDERSKKRKLTVVWTAHEPQIMAPYIPEVGFHWIYDKTTLDDIKIMFDHLGADYLLISLEKTRAWSFRQNDQMFETAFEPLKTLSGFWVFVRRGKADKTRCHLGYLRDSPL
jgi:hypothetical protein